MFGPSRVNSQVNQLPIYYTEIIGKIPLKVSKVH